MALPPGDVFYTANGDPVRGFIPMAINANNRAVPLGSPDQVYPSLSPSATPITANYSDPPTAASVTTSTSPIVAAGAYKTLVLQSSPTSSGNVWLNLAGNAAVVGKGVFIAAGGGTFTFGTAAFPMPTAAINGISDNGTVSVSIQGA